MILLSALTSLRARQDALRRPRADAIDFIQQILELLFLRHRVIQFPLHHFGQGDEEAAQRQQGQRLLVGGVIRRGQRGILAWELACAFENLHVLSITVLRCRSNSPGTPPPVFTVPRRRKKYHASPANAAVLGARMTVSVCMARCITCRRLSAKSGPLLQEKKSLVSLHRPAITQALTAVSGGRSFKSLAQLLLRA